MIGCAWYIGHGLIILYNEAVDILTKIIEEDGHCGLWATPEVCRRCPLSKLKQKPDGSYLSCVEALDASSAITEHEADELYKEAAIKLLLNKSIEDMLVGHEEQHEQDND